MNITPSVWVFKDFFGKCPRLNIPRFQREYSWEKKNYRQYLDDIFSCLRVCGNSIESTDYYLGTMIFVPENNQNPHSDLNVVDGQQRLTTVTILLAALSRAFHEAGDDENAKAIFDKYIMPRNRNHETKRILVSADNSKCLKFFIQSVDVALSDNLNKKEWGPYCEADELIAKTYDFFLREFNDETRVRRTLSALLKADLSNVSYVGLLEAIRDQVVGTSFISITVDDRDEGYQLFESLNSKGVPLSPVDMIKNRLFEELDTVEPFDYASEKWNIISRNIEDTGMTLSDYFYLFWRSHYSPNATKKRLFDDFKKKIKPSSYKAFLDELANTSKHVAFLVTPNLNSSIDPFKKKPYAYAPYISSFHRIEKDLNITQARIVNLALLEVRLKEEDKKKGEATVIKCKDMVNLAEFLEYFLFSFVSISGGGTNKYRNKLSSFAYRLHQCSNRGEALKIIKQLKEDLETLLPDETSFIKHFQDLRYTNNGDDKSGNPKSKYALWLLHHHFNKTHFEHDKAFQGYNVEHISSDEGDIPTISIGNLIMLERELNQEAGTGSQKDKIELYKNSDSAWVKKYVEIYEHGIWDDQVILDRSKCLAELAYKDVRSIVKSS